MLGKLYIIHGWTYTTDPWAETIAALKKQGITAEMLHVPGLTAPSKKVWTIEDYVRWADRQIPAGATVLGHSNGGRILLNLCSEKPDKFAHLILLDSAGVYEASSRRDVSRSLSKKLGFLKKVPGLTKVWHKLTGASDYDRAPANMKQTLANMLDSDKSLKLERVTTPTSILWGAADTVTPPRQAEVLHEKLPLNILQIHPGWTHAPYISHPAELASAIAKVYGEPPVRPPSPEAIEAVEKATSASASLSLRRAAEPPIPSTARRSASLSLKKSATRRPEPSSSRTVELSRKKSPSPDLVHKKPYSPVPATPKPSKSPSPQLPDAPEPLAYEPALLELPPRSPMISTADVPKPPKKSRKKSPKRAKTERTKRTKSPKHPTPDKPSHPGTSALPAKSPQPKAKDSK